MSEEKIRPTKKQKELLEFISSFIDEHGYSPSFREIKDGVGYNSVATVALHVNNLIKRGHLKKRDHSARSLEVIRPNKNTLTEKNSSISAGEEKWLVEKVEHQFKKAETSKSLKAQELDKLYVLVGALKVLGLEDASRSFIARLNELKRNLN